MTTGSLLLETRGLSPDSALEIIPAQEEETQEGEGGEATRQKESQEEAGSAAGEWCSRGGGAHPGEHACHPANSTLKPGFHLERSQSLWKLCCGGSRDQHRLGALGLYGRVPILRYPRTARALSPQLMSSLLPQPMSSYCLLAENSYIKVVSDTGLLQGRGSLLGEQPTTRSLAGLAAAIRLEAQVA